jgi:penicillin G amidase
VEPLMRVRVWRSLGLSALVLIAGSVAAGLWYWQASLPRHAGTLQVAGLGAPVKIERDAHAIPHIVAASEADALFALGYVHAQDRLWQMDFARRIAQGRLAELVGPAGVETDKVLRTLGIMRGAQQLLDAMDADTRAMVDAYVAGINAHLDTRSGPLPPEFLITRAPAPARWTALDSLGWAMMMALDMSSEWRDELARLRLAARFSLAEINDLRPPPGDAAPVATADYPELYRLLGVFNANGAPTRLSQDVDRRKALPSFGGFDEVAGLGGFGAGAGIGSNAWAVSAARSASGKPLLAADPHLALVSPSLWMLVRIDAPGLRVAGASLPGLPYVVLGRTAQVAWGLTSTHGDSSDLYLERLHPTDPALYQTPDGYAPFDTRTETIRVKGAPDLSVTVRGTRHGPVLSDALATPELAAERFVLAVRWGALTQPDHSLRALRAMNQAQSAAQLRAAAADWTLAQVNIVYADSAGETGLQMAGRAPRRGAAHDLRGVVPALGWDARYDWIGMLAPAELPALRAPESGWVINANNNAAPPGYPHSIGHNFAPTFRAQRIDSLLGAREKHDLASMQRIQTDERSLAAVEFVALLKDTQPQSEAGRLALARLVAWDGTMDANAPEPLLLHAWLRALRLRIFGDDLGAPGAQQLRGEMTQAMLNVLAGRARARDWCDDVTTRRVETCAELAAESLDAAVEELTRDSGRDVLGLRWGEVHVARLEHRPLSQVPILARWFEQRLPRGGDAHTVSVAALSGHPRGPYAAVHGPGIRLVFDLAQPGGAWINATGQVGHPLSAHYRDLSGRWQRGTYLLVGEGSASDVLQLLPAEAPPR